MFDIFLMDDVHKLMEGKSIVFLGDSNVRALYKDFLCLLHESRFIPQAKLKSKMEATLYGDKLVYHGRKTNGRCYREEREAFLGDAIRASFFFLTKVYDHYVESVLERITRRSNPDIIIINSCVWDITRWGCNGVDDYKENMKLLMKRFRRLLPDCLIIWITTPPLAAEVRGGFLVTELQFLKYSLRFHVVEANHYARKVVVENGFDVLDSHFHLQMQIHRRSPDGIHWDPRAVRYVTNLILRHISLSWNVPLPHRYESSVVDKNLEASEDAENTRITKFEREKNFVPVTWEPDVSELGAKLKSTVNVVKKTEDIKKEKRSSIQLYQVPKRGESIHKHMAKDDLRSRLGRIRQWKKPLLGDSPLSSAPSIGRKSCSRNRTRSKRDKRPLLETNLSNKLFQSSAPVHSSRKASTNKSLNHNVPLITDPSQIPLPPYSPGSHQSRKSHTQSDESQLPSFNRSSNFDFPLITSPSQIPLLPYSPYNQQSHNSHVQNDERSIHNEFQIITSPSQIPLYNQFDNAPPQRRVVDYQATRWDSFGVTNNGNEHAHSARLNQRFRQRKKVFERVDSSVKPYNFPLVPPGQILQPRFNFANDAVPQGYFF